MPMEHLCRIFRNDSWTLQLFLYHQKKLFLKLLLISSWWSGWAQAEITGGVWVAPCHLSSLATWMTNLDHEVYDNILKDWIFSWFSMGCWCFWYTSEICKTSTSRHQLTWVWCHQTTNPRFRCNLNCWPHEKKAFMYKHIMYNFSFEHFRRYFLFLFYCFIAKLIYLLNMNPDPLVKEHCLKVQSSNLTISDRRLCSHKCTVISINYWNKRDKFGICNQKLCRVLYIMKISTIRCHKCLQRGHFAPSDNLSYQQFQNKIFKWRKKDASLILTLFAIQIVHFKSTKGQLPTICPTFEFWGTKLW